MERDKKVVIPIWNYGGPSLTNVQFDEVVARIRSLYSFGADETAEKEGHTTNFLWNIQTLNLRQKLENPTNGMGFVSHWMPDERDGFKPPKVDQIGQAVTDLVHRKLEISGAVFEKKYGTCQYGLDPMLYARADFESWSSYPWEKAPREHETRMAVDGVRKEFPAFCALYGKYALDEWENALLREEFGDEVRCMHERENFHPMRIHDVLRIWPTKMGVEKWNEMFTKKQCLFHIANSKASTDTYAANIAGTELEMAFQYGQASLKHTTR
jgi:hypothetical protein